MTNSTLRLARAIRPNQFGEVKLACGTCNNCVTDNQCVCIPYTDHTGYHDPHLSVNQTLWNSQHVSMTNSVQYV